MTPIRAIYVLALILFFYFVATSRMTPALLVLGGIFVLGIWQIRRMLAEAREREARQWENSDVTIVMPRKPEQPASRGPQG
ncbi:hypothetical protein [Chitinimonas sp. BJYL2]|uniref:hypothetical protein n=1 Tax=Chitinimonas sp. BJYL2 TaxID=2976696 RepID=UPI0022B2FC32|nr:hypothetical protein [Chitinimonas sp. BJYL2]